MAVPTVSSITQTLGPTMGRALVEILGTNFRQATVESSGPTTVKAASVEVLFGTVPALRVQVVSDTQLFALSPAHDSGSVDITIQNLDDAGVAISGESVVSAGAYEFLAPKYTAEFPSDLLRLVKQLIRDIKQQVLPDITVNGKVLKRVSLAVSTDYDANTDATLHTTKLSKLPGIVLKGPDLVENRFYSVNEEPTYEVEGSTDGDFVITPVPYTVDLQFDVFGFSDSNAELINLMATLTKFFHVNKYISMLRDPDDASKGTVRYEMDFQNGGEFRASKTVINESNIRVFDGSIVIRGFDVEALAGIESGNIGDVPAHEVVQRSRDQGDNEVVLDPTEQTAISSDGPLVVSSIKSPGDC